jgi:hypothetical protein
MATDSRAKSFKQLWKGMIWGFMKLAPVIAEREKERDTHR